MSVMPNVITVFLAAKWMPYSPNRWVDPKGDHWLIDPEANSQVVSSAIIKDLHQLQLPRASGHYDSLGIRGGINWEYTLRFVRTLRLKPIHYCIQAALETVMCAACWPAQRIHDIDNQFLLFTQDVLMALRPPLTPSGNAKRTRKLRMRQ